MSIPQAEAKLWYTPPTEEGRYLPEGPRLITMAGSPSLVWVNIQVSPEPTAGQLYVHDLTTKNTESIKLPGRPGFVLPAPDREKAVTLGCEKTLGIFDLRSREWTPRATIPHPSGRTMINDAEPVPGHDAIVFGTKDIKFQDPMAHIYLWTQSDNHITPLADGQTCSNGKVFRTIDDQLFLFDIDTPTKTVKKYAFDIKKRSMELIGTAIDLQQVDAFPDGMADCGDGTVVIAFYNPNLVPNGKAIRYDLETGEAIEEWLVPGSPRVTCPLIYEWNGSKKLLLTTAIEGMPDDQRAQAPNAGCLFECDF